MKTGLIVAIGDTIYIEGEKTIVKSNRWMGNHKWISERPKVSPAFIRQNLAQDLVDMGQAHFYNKGAA
jgi:hypothetical protein